VTESVVERFIEYRSRCGKPADTAFRRVMARAWNANVGAIAGWPDVKLAEPPVKSTVEIAWSDFPEGLRRDIDSYLEGLTKVRRNRKGQRVRPLKPVTLRTRRAELQGAARMAVKVGVPVEKLNSLAAKSNRHSQRPHNRIACGMSYPHQELCRLGDWHDLQTGAG
jgi:hypothetical protein